MPSATGLSAAPSFTMTNASGKSAQIPHALGAERLHRVGALSRQEISARSSHPRKASASTHRGRKTGQAVRSRNRRGDKISTGPYRSCVKSRVLPVIRIAPPAAAVAR